MRGAGLILRYAPVSRGRASSRTTTVRSGRRPLDHGACHRNFLRPRWLLLSTFIVFSPELRVEEKRGFWIGNIAVAGPIEGE
jgi:hypothetical protein